MKKKKITAGLLAFAVSISLSLGLAGCGTAVKAEDMMSGIEAKTRVNQIEDKQAHRIAVTNFAVKTFQESIGEEGNILLSPVSILSALAMTANGAKGETLSQMEEAFGLPIDKLNAYLNAYVTSLPSEEKYKVSLANSIWFRDDERLQVNEDFLQANADYYHADIYKAPFDSGTLKDINHWVSEKTDGMINNILDKIPDEEILYLINALAFDAEWQNIYYDYQVQDGKFTTEDGEKRDVKLMYSEERRYLNDGMAEGLIKYYAGEKYAFAALLPKEGTSLADYVAGLTGEKLAATLESAEKVTVKAAIPKFESEYFADMSGLLAGLGMTNAFDESLADFTEIGLSNGGENNIFISRVLHKTFISVDERGTRAGAATVVAAADNAALIEEIKTVYLDRPFVYMLIDCEENIPLFIGCVKDIG